MRSRNRDGARDNCLNNPARWSSAALPRDRGEDEKGAAGCPEKQAYDPKAGSFCKRGDCRDGNRDLEHGHAAREHFVLMKV